LPHLQFHSIGSFNSCRRGMLFSSILSPDMEKISAS